MSDCPYCGKKVISDQRISDINGILYHYDCHRQMEESKKKFMSAKKAAQCRLKKKQKMKLKQVCEKYNVSYEDALRLSELWEREENE